MAWTPKIVPRGEGDGPLGSGLRFTPSEERFHTWANEQLQGKGMSPLTDEQKSMLWKYDQNRLSQPPATEGEPTEPEGWDHGVGGLQGERTVDGGSGWREWEEEDHWPVELSYDEGNQLLQSRDLHRTNESFYESGTEGMWNRDLYRSYGDQNYEQLRMFMPAGELRDVTPSDFGPDDAGPGGSNRVGEGWARKLEESKRGGYFRRHHFDPHHGNSKSLYDAVKKEGVVQPVEILNRYAEDTIYEGHHRIAASADIDPTMEVPVIHRGWSLGPTSDQWWRIRE